MLYSTRSGFLEGTTAFIRDGIERDEPVLVVVDADKIAALQAALDGTAARVHFADMATVGHNPARIIPAWHDFVDAHRGAGRRVRGVGEPIWAGRTPTELVECHQHEALLNLAFDDAEGFTLLCPYDTANLAPTIIEQARGTHPTVRHEHDDHDHDNDGGHGGDLTERYQGVHPDELLAEPLDPPPTDAVTFEFGPALRPVRHFASAYAADTGFEIKAADVALVVGELATNSLRHGGGRGTLLIWQGDGALICEVRDRGRITDPMLGRRRPLLRQFGGRGLWLINQLCDLVQIRSTAAGSVIRVHLRLT
jgi:anti-sigma regulatory factor (Ser/Thr protein kinase)